MTHFHDKARLGPSLLSEKNAGLNDPTFFTRTPTSFDIRESFRLVGLLILISPLGLHFLSLHACVAILVGSYALPATIRLRYPRFMEANILDDLDIHPGASLFCIAFFSATILQLHNTRVSIAAKFRSRQPLNRLIDSVLFMEMMLNGTSEEKEKTANWILSISPCSDGSTADKTHGELGIPNDVETHGFSDEMKVYMIDTLTFATIAFQTRFGRPLSKRAKDAVVLEYACMGMRIRVPAESLSKDYESFRDSFNHKLDILDTVSPFTRSSIENAEAFLLSAQMNWITCVLVRLALMIGFDLLPLRVRKKYNLKVLNSSWKRAIQKSLIAVLWFLYPMLMWLPLRGTICLFLVLEPQLRPIFMSSLDGINSMDVFPDKPVYRRANPPTKSQEISGFELPSYFLWLDSAKDNNSFLQVFLIRILEAQVMSAQASSLPGLSLGRITPWMQIPALLALLAISTVRRSILNTIVRWKIQIKESQTFKGNNSKMPQHLGIILDGNRRFARRIGQPPIFGHRRGKETTAKVFEWWLRFMPNTMAATHSHLGPRYITLWTFSLGNLQRPQEELDGLFSLMTAEFKSLAFTSLVHLFQIRARCIGSREGLPQELIDSIDLLEESTRRYSRLFLQFAVGYGGRDEIVRSVKHVLARGVEVTEDAISEGTFCAQVDVPPVDIIVRTSEYRTSGFFLWDTQAAELHFINKLWPEFSVGDWLDTLASFSRRKIRGGR